MVGTQSALYKDFCFKGGEDKHFLLTYNAQILSWGLTN